MVTSLLIFNNFMSIKKTIHYKKMMSYWDNQSLKNFASNSLINKNILKFIKKEKCLNLLELGSGRGHDTLFFIKNLNHKITCIDFSPKMTKLEKDLIRKNKLQKKVFVVCKNILKTKLPSNFFDIAIIKSFLHHLFSVMDIEFACKIVYNSLKKGGTLILVENWTDYSSSKYESRAFQISQKVRRIKDIKELFLSKNDYLKILKKTGFKKIKCSLLKDEISLDRYKLNSALEKSVEKLKNDFPNKKIRTLFVVGYK